MSKRNILMTEADAQRLRSLLGGRTHASLHDQEHLEDLRGELERATIVDPQDVPADLVTMYSQACVQDVETGQRSEYTLVFPWQADVAAGRVSVLAPLGTALLGYREGDEIEWPMPGGVRRLRILEVRQEPAQLGPHTRGGPVRPPAPLAA